MEEQYPRGTFECQTKDNGLQGNSVERNVQEGRL